MIFVLETLDLQGNSFSGSLEFLCERHERLEIWINDGTGSGGGSSGSPVTLSCSCCLRI